MREVKAAMQIKSLVKEKIYPIIFLRVILDLILIFEACAVNNDKKVGSFMHKSV